MNDPVRHPDPADTPAEPPAGWTNADGTPADPHPVATPSWMQSPPPATKSIRTPGNLVGSIVLLVIGVGLLLWGVPAVITHVQASMGMQQELPGLGNFARAGAAFLGFFLTFVGLGAVLRVTRNRRD